MRLFLIKVDTVRIIWSLALNVGPNPFLIVLWHSQILKTILSGYSELIFLPKNSYNSEEVAPILEALNSNVYIKFVFEIYDYYKFCSSSKWETDFLKTLTTQHALLSSKLFAVVYFEVRWPICVSLYEH